MIRYSKYIPFLFFISAVIIFSTRVCASEIPLYELHAVVSPSSHSIEGHAKITVPDGFRSGIQADGLKIQSLRINGTVQKTDKKSLEMLLDGKGTKIVEIDYSAAFEPIPQEKDGEDAGVVLKNAIDVSGVVLLSGWYPEIKGLGTYRLSSVEVPANFEAVSEMNSVTVQRGEGGTTFTFDFPHPVPGITLVAGKYKITGEEFHGIAIRTYFFSEDAKLSVDYINHAKKYLELYESMIGTYPYKTFSIVENNFQTGYSFPTYTLLGSQVIRLPFILETSLGHEILHQWFGNSVYVPEKGNWSEGLVTYLADHWYEDQKGKGAEYRKKILIDYMNSVEPQYEFSLAEFTGRTDSASKAIGYGKSAMVFHMLRSELGDDAFFKGLRSFFESRTFTEASWNDLRDSFSAASGKDLKPFFLQWVEKKGVPTVQLKRAFPAFRDGKFVLSLELIQEGDTYTLPLPASVFSPTEEPFRVSIAARQIFSRKETAQKPLKVILDPTYDVLRSLSDDELPPVISGFTGSKSSIVIVPENQEERFKDAADFFRSRGYVVKKEKEMTSEDLRKNSFLLLSDDSRVYREMFAARLLPSGGFVVRVEKNPLNPKKVSVIFHARTAEEFGKSYQKIFRYGSYSSLLFETGENRSKETAPAADGIIGPLDTQVAAVETKDTFGIEGVVEKIKGRKIICIGELHTDYSHHVMQFEIIRRLFAENRNIVIGMEMFQRPFQQYLDQYIKGEIAEEEFLKKSEYFTRWGFNYNFYRDILNFARANRIPVVALNLRKEIIDKVSKSGIASLSDDEFKEIPKEMDLTNREYRDFLKDIFDRHSSSPQRDFDNFFQSQILWDETMAQTIAETLKKSPDVQIIALAGGGHFLNSWGIPDRVKRLTGIAPFVILNSGGEKITREIADLVLYPGPVEGPEPPLLMVALKKAPEGILVEKLVAGGVAEKAGIKADDVLRTIDGRKIEDVADIKIALLDRRPGDRVKLTLSRKRFLFGRKDMVVEVELRE
ncbi:MAG: ChaN family lipoprotein [bacterium]